MATRGIRLKNPGNIEHSKRFQWDGEVYPQTELMPNNLPEDRFCQFETMEHGCRAMARILGNYQRLHDRKTIYQMVHRWAPPVENDTQAYAKMVAKNLGRIPENEINFIEDPTIAVLMMKTMARMENGKIANEAVTHDMWVKGHQMAWPVING